MADAPRIKNGVEPARGVKSRQWFSHNSKSIIFVIIMLALVVADQAVTILVTVFPSSAFSRIVIEIDNGLTSIEEMMVTDPRRVQQGVDSVEGLKMVRVITSRGP